MIDRGDHVREIEQLRAEIDAYKPPSAARCKLPMSGPWKWWDCARLSNRSMS
jgi:hypothetical protein